MRIRFVPAAASAAALALAFHATPGLAKKQSLDAGLYTNYSAGATRVGFIVCGALEFTNGCYGSGSLSPPFEQACAVLEGTSKQQDHVVTRQIYVLDKRTSSSAPIMLYVYTRTDTITQGSYDNIQVSLTKQIPLGLTGGTQSSCAMAANNAFVYAATSADTVAAAIDKNAYTVSAVGGFSPPAHIVSITADERGYVSIHFDEGYYTFGPDGSGAGDGGGAADMVGTRNAWKPGN